MNTRTIQGLALILSAITMLVGIVGPDNSLFGAISIIGTVLFIIGIPAVYTAQPVGTLGLVGIILMILSAIIALGFRLLDIELSQTTADILIWTSIISGSVGRLIIGWLTTRHRVFPAWVGWALIVEGLLVFVGGLIDVESFAATYNGLVLLVGALALLGYGYYLLKPRPVPAMT